MSGDLLRGSPSSTLGGAFVLLAHADADLLGRLLMKNSPVVGAISISKVGLGGLDASAELGQRARELPLIRRLTSFQPRMMSGAWLEANTPASLAMARLAAASAPRFSLFSENPLRTFRRHEIEPEQEGLTRDATKATSSALDRGPHSGFSG